MQERTDDETTQASAGSAPDEESIAEDVRTESVHEVFDSRGVTVSADRKAGLLRGVKLLGMLSRNGRSYTEGALRSAIGLYEGAKVNVNHAAGDPLAPRDYRDRIGVVRNIHLRPGKGLFGDLHCNPKHPLAEQLAWDAEHAPENVGLSHNVVARTRRNDSGLVVEAIKRVQSVDLVADPATTSGLYEHRDAPACTHLDLISPNAVASIANEAEESEVREHSALREGLLRVEAGLERLRRHVMIESLLKRYGLATEGDVASAPDSFVQQLHAATDDEVTRLVEERASDLRCAARGRPAAAPESVERRDIPEKGGPTRNFEGFLEAITRK